MKTLSEDLLQFIWQFQYFNQRELHTTDGKPLQILYQGQLNRNQGPDFLDGKIKCGDTTWAGNIEIHIKSSDWNLHKHSEDPRYNNVILHAVWQHDKEISISFPTLELQPLVSKILLEKYEGMMLSKKLIPCQDQLTEINPLTIIVWKQKLLVERLKQKARHIESGLETTSYYWEESLWQSIARSFGTVVNADAFESVAKTIPMKILGKHRNNLVQLEALLLGQAGLLEKEFSDKYPVLLQKEFKFLKKKYGLTQPAFPVSFLRMRPANFPGIRLAQLAALIYSSHGLFSRVKEINSVKELQSLFDVTANDYWHYHYHLEDEGVFKKKKLGKQMVNNIIINAVIPVLYHNGDFHNNKELIDKTTGWLEQLPAEKNSITNGFEAMGIENKNASDSQALIQLKKKYCDVKLCLKCSIGNAILKKEKQPADQAQ